MSVDRSNWGMSFGLGLVFYGIYVAIAEACRFVIRHPIATIFAFFVLWLTANIFHIFDSSFGILTRDVPAMMKMDERQFAKEFSVNSCSQVSDTMECDYDDYDMTVTFRNHRPFIINMNAGQLVGEKYILDEDFYRYVMERSGMPYSAPTHTTIDSIVWTNVPDVGSVTLLTDEKMKADRMIILGKVR